MTTSPLKTCPLKQASTWQMISSLVIGGLFCYAGVMHFLKPKFFMKIVPPVLPLHREAVLISGFFEILGGLGMFIPAALPQKNRSLSILQRSAGIGLIALLAAVFPANIYVACEPQKFDFVPAWVWYLRLPFQFVFMAWVNWASKPSKDI